MYYKRRYIMSTISMRVSDSEREILDKASKAYGCNVSMMIKKIVFEKLEDEYDLKVFDEYENDKANGKVKTYSHDEAWKLLGF